MTSSPDTAVGKAVGEAVDHAVVMGAAVGGTFGGPADAAPGGALRNAALLTAVAQPAVARAVERSPVPPAAALARQITLDATFARVARACPDRTAVRTPGGRITFRGAEVRARQLASLLVRRGVQLGDPVIVHCGDHRHSLVAQLAVLKAGGVCVPVPAATRPDDRRAIIELSGAQAVLCAQGTQAAWAASMELVLRLDQQELWRQAESVRPDDSLPRSGPIDPAYLLVSRQAGHEELVNELIDHRAWQLAAAARSGRIGPADHGVEVRQQPGTPVVLAAMWWAFASSRTLYCGHPDSPLDRSPVTVLTPQDYDRLLVPGSAGPRVTVLLGGPCPPGLAARHHDIRPSSQLWAEFAPSAGALPWAAQDLTGAVEPDGVGRPVWGVQVHVLGPGGAVAAPGAQGEVCAAGPALAFDRVAVRLGEDGADDSVLGPLVHSGLRGRAGQDGVIRLCPPRARRSAV